MSLCKVNGMSNIQFQKMFLQKVFRNMFRAIWSQLVSIYSDTFFENVHIAGLSLGLVYSIYSILTFDLSPN